MGCGQSKIHLYPRKSKSKANGKKSGHVDAEADADDDDGHIEEGEKDINRDKDRLEDDAEQMDEKCSSEGPNGDISVSLLRAKNLSLLQSQEISTSQQNFFRMLDRKIDEGPDYDSASETEIALEEARLNALVQHWESASLTASMCSSASRSLQTTPIRQVPIRQPPQLVRSAVAISPQPLSAELLPHNANHSAQPPCVLVGQHAGMLGSVMAQQAQLMAKPSLSPKRTESLTPQNSYHQAYIMQQQSQMQMQMQPQASLLVGRPPRPAPMGLPMGGTMAGVPPHMQMAYYGHQPQAYFADVMHPIQPPQAPPEYRFPPAISVQRLAPQVQRQLRETQELIKDSCPQLYAAGYGSPGPPIRNQSRSTARRPTLETQFSQELS